MALGSSCARVAFATACGAAVVITNVQHLTHIGQGIALLSHGSSTAGNVAPPGNERLI